MGYLELVFAALEMQVDSVAVGNICSTSVLVAICNNICKPYKIVNLKISLLDPAR